MCDVAFVLMLERAERQTRLMASLVAAGAEINEVPDVEAQFIAWLEEEPQPLTAVDRERQELLDALGVSRG